MTIEESVRGNSMAMPGANDSSYFYTPMEPSCTTMTAGNFGVVCN